MKAIKLRLRWAGHVARKKDGSSSFTILTWKPTENRPLGRPRHRCEDYIGMNLKKMGVITKN